MPVILPISDVVVFEPPEKQEPSFCRTFVGCSRSDASTPTRCRIPTRCVLHGCIASSLCGLVFLTGQSFGSECKAVSFVPLPGFVWKRRSTESSCGITVSCFAQRDQFASLAFRSQWPVRDSSMRLDGADGDHPTLSEECVTPRIQSLDQDSSEFNVQNS